MDEPVVEILHIEFFGSCADVSILVPIAFLVAVDAGDTDIGSNIEFTFLVEEGHYVLLNYMSPRATHLVDAISSNDVFDFL